MVPPQTGQFHSERGWSLSGRLQPEPGCRRATEQLEAERQERSASPVGEEAEVADAHEAARQQVEQEAAQELLDRQSHQPLLVAMGGVSPAEGDVAFVEGDQSVVGDGDAMGVAAEIAQHVFRPAEGSSWNRRPSRGGTGTRSQAAKARGSARGRSLPWNWSVPVGRRCRSPATNLPRKTRLSTLTGRKKESARGDPAGVIGSETAGGEYAVDMRMKQQSLIPGMEHAEEADLRAEVPGIAGDLEQSLGTGMEQQVVDHLLVLQGEWGQFARQREDHMHIAGGQEFPFARLEPAQTRVGLASWTMPIAARVVGDGVVCPQPEQRSRCPPSAAVRQRVMASSTFWCCQVIHLRLCSRKACPAQRTMSAISSGGRLMRLCLLSSLCREA